MFTLELLDTIASALTDIGSNLRSKSVHDRVIFSRRLENEKSTRCPPKSLTRHFEVFFRCVFLGKNSTSIFPMFPCDKSKLFDQTNKTNKLCTCCQFCLFGPLFTIYCCETSEISRQDFPPQKTHPKNTSKCRACDFGGHRMHISFSSLRKKYMAI